MVSAIPGGVFVVREQSLVSAVPGGVSAIPGKISVVLRGVFAVCEQSLLDEWEQLYDP